jgi:hypothetical protein
MIAKKNPANMKIFKGSNLRLWVMVINLEHHAHFAECNKLPG